MIMTQAEYLAQCSAETLAELHQAAKRIDDNHRRMKDATILKKLADGSLRFCELINWYKQDREWTTPARDVEFEKIAVSQNPGIFGMLNNHTKEICEIALSTMPKLAPRIAAQYQGTDENVLRAALAAWVGAFVDEYRTQIPLWSTVGEQETIAELAVDAAAYVKGEKHAELRV